MEHNEHCEWKNGWYIRPECRAYSTDGTALGAEIAHTMGTDSEEEISSNALLHPEDVPLTGMVAEQAEWEADE